MPKISALPPMTTPHEDDPAPLVDDSVTSTKKLTLGAFRDWLYSLVNIPAGPSSPVTRDSEHFLDHVASGLVWSGDSYGSTLNASMTSGIIYINGRRISISAVAARGFTASKDTYIDVLDNGDGTGTLVYTEVANNAASPALAANSVRIGIIVTGASSIANVGAVNQGQEDKVLPIASSLPYAVADSLGNLICPRDPQRRTLLVRHDFTGTSTTSSSPIAIPRLAGYVKVPTGRKIKVTISGEITQTAAYANLRIYEGTIAGGTAKVYWRNWRAQDTGRAVGGSWIWEWTPASDNPLITIAVWAEGGGTATFGTTGDGANLIVELM